MTVDLGALAKDGFCLAEGISDPQDLVQTLGPIRVDPRSPEPVRDIRPQSVSSAKLNTLSSRYGTGSFPFHTDAAHWQQPARYLALFCVSPGEGARPTHIQDSRTWDFSDAEEDLACQSLWAVGHRRPRLSSAVTRFGGYLVIRYDMDCMRPMTAATRKLKEILDDRISNGPRVSINWQAGGLLVIDNHRMLHARGEAERPDPNRLLQRILVGGN